MEEGRERKAKILRRQVASMLLKPAVRAEDLPEIRL